MHRSDRLDGGGAGGVGDGGELTDELAGAAGGEGGVVAAVIGHGDFDPAAEDDVHAGRRATLGGEGGAGGPVPGVADGPQRLLLGGGEPVPGSRLTFRAAHVDFLPEFHLILRRFRRRVSMGRLRSQSALGHHHGKRIGA